MKLSAIYHTPLYYRRAVKARRDRLREMQLCINGPFTATQPGRNGVLHGPVVQGGKCQRCLDIWRRSK